MVVLEDVTKTYKTGRGDIKALDRVNMRVEKGEFVVINGPSGSGKTTLLMTIAAMLRPSSGKVCIGGKKVYDMSIRARANFRAENIGFVFQLFYLVPYLNVFENIALARQSTDRGSMTNELERLVKQFGLERRAFHKPSQLSAGEKQRTAIARALLNRPQLILADEPTGNLDVENATAVLGYLDDFHRDGGTVIVVTHASGPEEFADRIIYLRDGGIDNSSRKQ
jgi:putative ABC transport system ATP-binding protein